MAGTGKLPGWLTVVLTNGLLLGASVRELVDLFDLVDLVDLLEVRRDSFSLTLPKMDRRFVDIAGELWWYVWV